METVIVATTAAAVVGVVAAVVEIVEMVKGKAISVISRGGP
jgi:hypothetical protein